MGCMDGLSCSTSAPVFLSHIIIFHWRANPLSELQWFILNIFTDDVALANSPCVGGSTECDVAMAVHVEHDVSTTNMSGEGWSMNADLEHTDNWQSPTVYNTQHVSHSGSMITQ